MNDRTPEKARRLARLFVATEREEAAEKAARRRRRKGWVPATKADLTNPDSEAIRRVAESGR